MFNTVTPDRAMSEGSPRMMIIIFLVIIYYGALGVDVIDAYNVCPCSLVPETPPSVVGGT